MRVTLLGHASVLIEMNGARCLMDPVFDDPFEEGVVATCPRRIVHVDKLPKIDVLILSHAHPDHFHIPSLARLSRDSQVLCPRDKVLTYALDRLGFKKVEAAKPNTRFDFDVHEFFTTHSNVSNVIEFGVVFKDGSGTFWNQVDTVLAPHTIEETMRHAGPIDLLFAMYASQNFGFFDSKPATFPFAMHEMNLSTVLAIHPRVVVPGSAGFRFCAPVEWCNSFLFPMSRERFVRDLARLDPSIVSRIANPGDVFEIEGGKVHHRPGASPVAETCENDTARLRFDPTAVVPALTDPNPDSYPELRMELAVETCLDDLCAFATEAYSTGDPIVDEYRSCRSIYALGVVFPDCTERWCRIAFEADAPRFEAGAAGPGEADTIHHIAASALTAWLSRERTYFYLRAFSRKFTTHYVLHKADGRASVEPKPIEDLLGYFLNQKAKGAELALKTWLDKQLEPFVGRART
jgi:L-ascorbate metabolism protein UlaG (beta-lactamase superfamily)